MRRLSIAAITIAALLTTSSAFALSLTLQNQTGKELHELYFAPAGGDDWGPDQLGDQVVASGSTFTLNKISKGQYDVLFVDEAGGKCDIRNVDFRSSETFVMTKEVIRGCQAATAAAAEEEEGDDE